MIESAVEAAQGVLFDMDGVLWHGGEAIVGASRVLRALQRRGKTVLFITNNAAKARSDYATKIKRLCDATVTEKQILSSAFAAAHVCRGRKKVYAIGEAGLFAELRNEGIIALGEDDSTKTTNPQGGEAAPAIDTDVSDVVVGFDGRLNYYKLAIASRCLRELPGCRFVACNTDRVVPIAGGVLMPGCGAGVAALQTCLPPGFPMLVCGKPEPLLWQIAAQNFGLEASRCIMVGDSIETDIAFGRRCGLQTLLVMSGVTSDTQLASLPSDQHPTFVIPSLASLFVHE